jgi:hypothetical protein
MWQAVQIWASVDCGEDVRQAADGVGQAASRQREEAAKPVAYELLAAVDKT